MTTYRALLCDDHGLFENDRDKCAVCGKYFAKNPALLCNFCGLFDSDREKCCVCDKWPARHPGRVCDYHQGKCVKCGKSL